MIENNKNKGFTLVEVLVSLFVFSLLSVAISSVYIAFSKAQTRTKVSQKLLNDMQYSMEMMAREIRNNEIVDFDPDCTELLGDDYGSCILFKKEDGSVSAFATSTDDSLYYLNLTLNTEEGQIYYPSDNTSITKLLDEELNNANINLLKFDISPNTNPYEDESNNEHPRVTIGLDVDYVSDREVEQINYFLQTTVSSRIYRR